MRRWAAQALACVTGVTCVTGATTLLAACGPSAEAIERDRVLHAIDELRDAPSDNLEARRKLVAALRGQPAVVPAIVRARDTCVTAYRLLIDGSELQSSVRSDLARGAVDPDLAARLLDAEAKIKQSATVMPDCERAIADLRLPARH